MKLFFFNFKLKFKYPIQTSREKLYVKKTYFLKWKYQNTTFISECPYFQGLSFESEDLVIKKMNWLCNNLFLDQEEIVDNLKNTSSVLFSYEQIVHLLNSKNPYLYFPSHFTNHTDSIKINGLIWSGKLDFIKQQIQEKINQGYKCLKFKIGYRWYDEIKILQNIRNIFTEKELELRVDANGAFSFEEAKIILEKLNVLKIHSIEQPIKVKNWNYMYQLCRQNLIPIALDEELIGINTYSLKEELLENILPQYLVLKPSLIGGLLGTLEWIQLCKKYNISWWITSSLESNIGLNFIAQFTYNLHNNFYQGLGTGNLFINNFYSPLYIKNDKLFFSFNHVIEH